MSSTLDRLSTRSASAQQVNLANLRASTAISSTGHRTGGGGGGTSASAGGSHHHHPRPSSVASNVRSSLVGQKSHASSLAAAAAASQRASNVRRMRNMLDMESSRSIPTPTPTRNLDSRLLDINPAGETCDNGRGGRTGTAVVVQIRKQEQISEGGSNAGSSGNKVNRREAARKNGRLPFRMSVVKE